MSLDLRPLFLNIFYIFWIIDDMSPVPQLLGCIARSEQTSFAAACFGIILVFDGGQFFHSDRTRMDMNPDPGHSDTLLDDHSGHHSL